MQTYLTTKSGRKLILDSPEEDAAITAAAMSDPDNPPLTDGQLAQFKPVRGRPSIESPKESVTIRYDRDVIAAFKATGKGWQTRMNEALREWINKNKAA